MIETIAEKNSIGYKQLVSQISFYLIHHNVQMHSRIVHIGYNMHSMFASTAIKKSSRDGWFCVTVHIFSFTNLLNDFQIKLRGFLSHIQQLRISYWGLSSVKSQSISPHALPSPRPKDGSDQNQQPAEASVVGRSWVQSMFSRDTSARLNLGRSGRWSSDGGCLICSFHQDFVD